MPPRKDLTGQRFGRLVALEPLPGYKWRCKCDCGKECDVAASSLLGGRTRSCGCLNRENRTRREDITGRRFGCLEVVEMRPNLKWLCRCDCGNERVVSRQALLRGRTKSCGCIRVERIESMAWEREQGHAELEKLRIDGTCIPAIMNTRKVNKNSSTGVRGVSITKRGYRATIVFKRKQYDLGTFPTIDAAAAARERAEKEIYRPFLDWYEQNKKEPPSK